MYWSVIVSKRSNTCIAATIFEHVQNSTTDETTVVLP